MATAAQLATLHKHIDAERRHDYDAIVQTISKTPFYYIPNYLLTTREAVRAMYELVHPALTPENMDEYEQALEDKRICFHGENLIYLEYNEDYPLHYGMVVVIRFDEDDLIVGEQTYFTHTGRFGSLLPDSFERVPGVQRLK